MPCPRGFDEALGFLETKAHALEDAVPVPLQTDRRKVIWVTDEASNPVLDAVAFCLPAEGGPAVLLSGASGSFELPESIAGGMVVAYSPRYVIGSARVVGQETIISLQIRPRLYYEVVNSEYLSPRYRLMASLSPVSPSQSMALLRDSGMRLWSFVDITEQHGGVFEAPVAEEVIAGLAVVRIDANGAILETVSTLRQSVIPVDGRKVVFDIAGLVEDKITDCSVDIVFPFPSPVEAEITFEGPLSSVVPRAFRATRISRQVVVPSNAAATRILSDVPFGTYLCTALVVGRGTYDIGTVEIRGETASLEGPHDYLSCGASIPPSDNRIGQAMFEICGELGGQVYSAVMDAADGLSATVTLPGTGVYYASARSISGKWICRPRRLDRSVLQAGLVWEAGHTIVVDGSEWLSPGERSAWTELVDAGTGIKRYGQFSSRSRRCSFVVGEGLYMVDVRTSQGRVWSTSVRAANPEHVIYVR